MILKRVTSCFGGQATITVALLGLGYVLGAATGSDSVLAENRRNQTEQQHFQSGAQRSETLLREISAKLETMDQRLERMEKMAKTFIGSTNPRTLEATR